MMQDPSLAMRLARAHDTGDIVTPAPDELPADLAGANAILDAIAAGLGPIAAYKLGATIPQVRATLGLPGPFFAPVPTTRLFPDGSDLPRSVARQRGVESEYAFCLARDLTPDDAGRDAAGLWSAIASLHPAIEIPGSRFAGLGLHGGLALVADLGAMGALVVGPGREPGDPAALADAAVLLEIEDGETILGSGAVIDGGPLGPLPGFLRQALARGHRLRAGQYIVTGSCTGYVEIPYRKRITARFAALDASVSMRFVDAA